MANVVDNYKALIDRTLSLMSWATSHQSQLESLKSDAASMMETIADIVKQIEALKAANGKKN